MENKTIVTPPGWEEYKKWWQRDHDKLRATESYDQHPVMTHAAVKTESVIGIMNTQTMRYSYFSPNLYAFTGWDKEELEKNGVAYTYSTMPLNDIKGAAIFSELITKSFKALRPSDRLNFKAIWDKRISNKRDGYFKILQICSPIKYDQEGNIDDILFFATKIDNIISPESQRLRMTDGVHDIFYRYDHKTGKLAELALLSERELQIAKLAAKSMTLKEIASELNISFNTVKAHSGNIIQKMNAKNSVEMVNILRTWQFL